MRGGVGIQPVTFDVLMVKDLAGKFSGRSTFIKAVEDVVSRFYEVAGQNLQSWIPKAPKVSKKEEDEAPDLVERETITVPKAETPLTIPHISDTTTSEEGTDEMGLGYSWERNKPS